MSTFKKGKLFYFTFQNCADTFLFEFVYLKKKLRSRTYMSEPEPGQDWTGSTALSMRMVRDFCKKQKITKPEALYA